MQDAYYIYQELVDKYGSTPLLLNGQAVTFIGQGKYEEADVALQEALDRDSNNPEVLINMIALQRHLEKGPEVCVFVKGEKMCFSTIFLQIGNRYLSQLKDAHPEHPYIKDLKQKETEFERICQQYSPSSSVTA